jgi:hypothetical protein
MAQDNKKVKFSAPWWAYVLLIPGIVPGLIALSVFYAKYSKEKKKLQSDQTVSEVKGKNPVFDRPSQAKAQEAEIAASKGQLETEERTLEHEMSLSEIDKPVADFAETDDEMAKLRDEYKSWAIKEPLEWVELELKAFAADPKDLENFRSFLDFSKQTHADIEKLYPEHREEDYLAGCDLVRKRLMPVLHNYVTSRHFGERERELWERYESFYKSCKPEDPLDLAFEKALLGEIGKRTAARLARESAARTP